MVTHHSDCGAVGNVETAHHYTNTTDATCADTLGAGMDNDCGHYFGRNGAKGALQPAIDDGSVSTKVSKAREPPPSPPHHLSLSLSLSPTHTHTHISDPLGG